MFRIFQPRYTGVVAGAGLAAASSSSSKFSILEKGQEVTEDANKNLISTKELVLNSKQYPLKDQGWDFVPESLFSQPSKEESDEYIEELFNNLRSLEIPPVSPSNSCVSLESKDVNSYNEVDNSMEASENAIIQARISMNDTKILRQEARKNLQSGIANELLDLKTFVNENPEAKEVVNSVVTDPGIWKAMKDNPAVQKFIQKKHKITLEPMEEAQLEPDSISNSPSLSGNESSDGTNGSKNPSFFNNIVDILQKIKESFKSIFFQIFTSEKNPVIGNDPNDEDSYGDFLFSLVFKLGIIVMLDIVFRRWKDIIKFAKMIVF